MRTGHDKTTEKYEPIQPTDPISELKTESRIVREHGLTTYYHSSDGTIAREATDDAKHGTDRDTNKGMHWATDGRSDTSGRRFAFTLLKLTVRSRSATMELRNTHPNVDHRARECLAHRLRRNFGEIAGTRRRR